jgi:hypothetical protein
MLVSAAVRRVVPNGFCSTAALRPEILFQVKTNASVNDDGKSDDEKP